MVFSSLFVAAAAVLVAAVAAAPGPVLVTGATGRLGSQVYKLLRAQRGAGNVRAMVTNLTKAKEVLGCTKCDASEG